jgi:hypothetical protein
MANPFQHFLLFLWAVLNQVVTLAAGCAVTVLIGIIEKRVLKRPISIKLEIGILLAFVFFACFQTWRDQYARAQGLQTTLNQKPAQPQVQVNVPPPTVIIQQSEHHVENNPEPSGFLQIERLQFSTDQHILTDGQIVTLNIAYKNPGPYPVTDRESFGILIVADRDIPDYEQFAKSEHEMRSMFEKFRKQAVQKTAQQHLPLASVGVNQIVYTSAPSPALTPTQVSGILNGATRIYAFTWTQWKDSHKRTGTFNGCFWMQPPKNLDLLASDPVWHSCDGPL